MKKIIFTIFILIFSIFVIAPVVQANNTDGFTKEDRKLLIKLEVILNEFQKSVDQRFKQVDQRFEQVDQRFESMERTFDARLEFIQNLLVAMLSVVLASWGIFVGLILWDRRTLLDKAKEASIKEVKEKYITRIIHALKDWAQHDTRLMEVLKQHHLL